MSIKFYDKYTKTHLKAAVLYSELSVAERLKCGALLVTPDNTRSLMIGYNGTLRGQDNRCEKIVYTCDKCFKEDEESFECSCSNDSTVIKELKTLQSVVHAEANVILACARNGIKTDGCILYVTTSPCIECAKMIIASGIQKVFYKDDYRLANGIELLRSNGVSCQKIDLQ